MTAVCPICDKDDAMQKVSSIVTAGVSSGTFSGPSGGTTYSEGKWHSVQGYTTLSGTSSTVLARLLAPPSEPHKASCGPMALAIIALAVLGFWVFTPILWGALGALQVVSSAFSGDTSQNGLGLVCAGIGGVGLLGYVGIAIVGLRFASSREKQASDNVARQKVAWAAAMAKWDCLYYCHRDDVVFDSQTQAHFPPGQTREYIYQSG